MQPLHRGILYLFYLDEIHEYDLDVGDLVTGERLFPGIIFGFVKISIVGIDIWLISFHEMVTINIWNCSKYNNSRFSSTFQAVSYFTGRGDWRSLVLLCLRANPGLHINKHPELEIEDWMIFNI